MNKSKKIVTALIVSSLMVTSSGLTAFAEPADSTVADDTAPVETAAVEDAEPEEAATEETETEEAVAEETETEETVAEETETEEAVVEETETDEAVVEEVVIGENEADNELTEINTGAIMKSTDGNFTYDVDTTTGGIKIMSYTGSDAIATIPDTLPDSNGNELSVTTIYSSAFANKAVTTVILGNNITTISNNAFMNATLLETITLPDSVTSLGSSAFSGCSKLTTINFPSGITKIPTGCFSNCKELDNITIPATITSIDMNAFSNCSSLSNVEFESRTTVTISSGAFSGCTNAVVFSVAYDLTGKRLAITGVSTGDVDIAIPNTIDGLPVVAIADSAFARSNIETVTIAEGVETLGASAFSNATKLRSVTLPSSITEISDSAFDNCTSLEFVTNPDDPKQDTIIHNKIVKIGKYAFRNCKQISEVELPASVTRILAGAFQNCTGITKVEFTDNVTELGEEAFRGCSSLKELTLSGGMTTIPRGAFAQCSSLEKVNFPSGISIIEDGRSTSGSSPIGDGAFSDCYALTELNFHTKFRKIGACAFSDCIGIKKITLNEGLTEIGNLAFSGDISLDNVVIPSSIQTINYGTFSHCTSLKSVTIPKNVTTIKGGSSFKTASLRNNGAFGYCTSLKEISLPGVTDLGAYAFSECTSLTSVKLADKVITNIGDYAFAKSTSLEGITLPDSIEKIGRGAFKGCTALKSIVIPTNVKLTQINPDTFAQCSSLTKVTIPDNITAIGAGSKLTNASINAIADGAFSDCISLVSIKLPKNLTTIGKAAFSGCWKLASIDIPDAVTLIGDYAFYDCREMKKVKFGAAVNSLGMYSFENCITLPEFTIPSTIKSIGKGALSSCEKLTKLTVESDILIKDFYTNVFLSHSGECTKLYNNVSSLMKDNVQTLILSDGVTNIGENALGNAEKLSTVELSEGVKTIERRAFYKCLELKAISTIPKNVYSIGEEAFNGCTNMEKIVIPSTVETIGNNAFAGCYNLTIFGKTGSAAENYCKSAVESIIFKNVYFETTVTSQQLSNGNVKLTWNKNPEYDDVVYYIYRSAGTNDMEKIGETTGTTYTDKTAVSGGCYTYYIACYNKEIDLVTDPSNPTVVTSISVKVTNKSSKKVTLSWTAIKNATGYRVKSADGTKTYTTDSIKTNTYTVTGLTNGTKYQFKVEACVGGVWYSSTAVSATPTGSPQNVQVTRASKCVPISWDAVDGADYYVVKSADGTKTYTGKLKTNSTTISGLTNYTEYKFKVYAYIDGKWFGSSTKTMTPSAAPQNVKATTASHQIKLTWDKVNGATSYVIKSADGKKVYAANVKTNSYTVKGLTNGTKYEFKVYAKVDGKWGTSYRTSKTPSGAPQSVTATAGSKSVKLSWEKVDGATGYMVKSADGKTSYTKKSIKTNSYTVTGLTAGTQYKFKVYAYVDGKWYASATKTKTPKA